MLPLSPVQQLRARTEAVGPDGEDRVLARLVLTKLRTDARQQHREPERLGDVVVGAGFESEDGVGIGIVAGQHDDRRLEAALAQNADRLAAIHVGQADIHDDQVDLPVLGGLHALGAGILGCGLEFLVQGKLLDQGVAQLGVVVHDQDFSDIRHGWMAPPRVKDYRFMAK